MTTPSTTMSETSIGALTAALQIAPGGSSGTAGYSGGMLLGAVITTAALAISLLIPRPEDAETPAIVQQKESVR